MYWRKRRTLPNSGPRGPYGYSGPYPHRMLNEAKYELMRIIDDKDTVIWYRLRYKLGIYEERETVKAPHASWGQPSTHFSHAELTKEQMECCNYPTSHQSTSAAAPIRTATVTTSHADSKLSNTPDLSAKYQATGHHQTYSHGENSDGKNTQDSITKTVSSQNVVSMSVGQIDKPEDNKNYLKVIATSSKLEDNSNRDNQKQNKNEIVGEEVIKIDVDDPVEIVEISDDSEVEFIKEEKIINDNSHTAVQENSMNRDVNNSALSNDNIQVPSESKQYHLQPNQMRQSYKRSDYIPGSVHSCKEELESSENNNIQKEIGTPAFPVASTESKSFNRHSVSSLEELSSNMLDQNNNNTNTVLKYKCDFCEQMCDTPSEMNNHLNASEHYSGSKISLAKDSTSFTIIEKLAVMKIENLFKKVVAICPNEICNEIFPTIYACSQHHKIRHDSVGDLVYGLTHVLHTDVFTNPCFSLACPVCNAPCTSRDAVENRRLPRNFDIWSSLLNMHFSEKHWPFDHTIGDCHFICPDCNVSFNDLKKALKHGISHKGLPIMSDTKLKVIQTGEIKVNKLPPCDGSSSALTSLYNQGAPINYSGNLFQRSTAYAVTNTQGIQLYQKAVSTVPFDNSSTAYSSNQTVQTSVHLHDGKLLSNTVSNTTNQIYSAYSKIQGPSIETTQTQSEGITFQCDFCHTKDKNKMSIYKHLLDECHGSASSIQLDSTNQPVAMLKYRAVVNYRGAFKTLVVACPIEGCTKIFSDMFQSNAHVSMAHSCNENVYGISKILKSVIQEQSPHLVCKFCLSKFQSRHLLAEHIKKENHYIPDHKDNSLNYNKHWICVYCEYNFESRLKAMTHILNMHSLKSIKGLFKIRVIHVEKKVDKNKMLPFSNDKEGNAKNIALHRTALNKLKLGENKATKKTLEKERVILKKKKEKKI